MDFDSPNAIAGETGCEGAVALDYGFAHFNAIADEQYGDRGGQVTRGSGYETTGEGWSGGWLFIRFGSCLGAAIDHITVFTGDNFDIPLHSTAVESASYEAPGSGLKGASGHVDVGVVPL